MVSEDNNIKEIEKLILSNQELLIELILNNKIKNNYNVTNPIKLTKGFIIS